MKTMWTFSIIKGWYRSENSLADLTTTSEARNNGFEQLDTHPQIHQINTAFKQVVFFQRVKKAQIDYLGRYTVGKTEFWFYMPNTASFIEVFCRHQPIMVRMSNQDS